MVDAGLILSRFCHYLAVTALFGGVLFPLYAGVAQERAALRRLRIATAILTLATALAWFVFTIASMAGDLFALAEPSLLASVATTTGFGRLWMIRLALAALMIGLVLPRSPSRRLDRASALVAGVLIASLAGTGHGPSPGGPGGWPHLAADGLHLLAAGAWLGAFPPLVMLVFGPLEKEAAVARAHGALDAFSRIGPAVVALIVLSGVVNGWYLVGPSHLTDLATTPWGATLVVKLALFAGMLALAAAHRWRLVPALAASGGGLNAVRALRRALALEAALGFAVLGAVSVLGTLQPASVTSPSYITPFARRTAEGQPAAADRLWVIHPLPKADVGEDRSGSILPVGFRLGIGHLTDKLVNGLPRLKRQILSTRWPGNWKTNWPGCRAPCGGGSRWESRAATGRHALPASRRPTASCTSGTRPGPASFAGFAVRGVGERDRRPWACGAAASGRNINAAVEFDRREIGRHAIDSVQRRSLPA